MCDLAATDDLALHMPPGVAHGYQTLEDDTRLTYLISGAYSPDHARTLRWDDPTVGIEWPLAGEPHLGEGPRGTRVAAGGAH